MARIDRSSLSGQTRNLPISDRLRSVLLAAADAADVDVVRVTSGGQPASGSHRTGSHRHDNGNAADLELIVGSRTLDFTNSSDLPIVERFVSAAASFGANGIGAGVGYMGPTKLHVGFGNSPSDTQQLVWGAKGASANAPSWLRVAAKLGWGSPATPGVPSEDWAQNIDGGITMSIISDVERFRPMLDFIATHEVGTTEPRGYNISLLNGRLLPGGVEQDLVSKTLDEIDVLQTYMLNNPKNRFNSSALGRYQIVRTTLRGLKSELGLSGSQLYSADLQDQLAVTLLRRRGRNAIALGQEWASLKNISSATLIAKFDEMGTGKVTPGKQIETADLSPQLLSLLLNLIRQVQSGAGPDDSDWPVLKLGSRGEAVERLQTLLNELKYYTGGTDGKYESFTRGAVALFQLDNSLEVTGVADAKTWAALTTASPRPVPEERAQLDADDLRKLGSQTVKNADRVRYAGWLTGLLGLGGLTKSGACTALGAAACAANASVSSKEGMASALDRAKALFGQAGDQNVDQAVELLKQLLGKAKDVPVTTLTDTAMPHTIQDLAMQTLSGIVPGASGSLVAMGLGLAFHLFGSNIIQRRVEDQRDARHVGSAVI